MEAASAPCATPGTAVNTPPDFQICLQELRSALLEDMKKMMKDVMGEMLTSLSVALESTKAVVSDQGRRLTEMEGALSDYSDRTVRLEAQYADLKKQNAALTERMENAENYSRRYNLRVTGIPEGSEKDDSIRFMSEFFKEVLGDMVFPSAPKIDMAHRIGRETTGPPGQTRPRVMIVRFHYFQDKTRALTTNRNQLRWRDQRILLFSDYSAHAAKQRASFTRVKALLFARRIRFRLIFPAILKVDFMNKTHTFPTAEEAQKYYNEHIAKDSTHSEGDAARAGGKN